jgi:hypothetical protein
MDAIRSGILNFTRHENGLPTVISCAPKNDLNFFAIRLITLSNYFFIKYNTAAFVLQVKDCGRKEKKDKIQLPAALPARRVFSPAAAQKNRRKTPVFLFVTLSETKRNAL